MESLNFDDTSSAIIELNINGDENRIIRFCPTDPKLLFELSELAKRIDAHAFTTESEELAYEEECEKELNKMFGMDVCTPVFQGKSIFTIVGMKEGRPIQAVGAFLTAIVKEMSQRVDSAVTTFKMNEEKYAEETAEYTEKYAALSTEVLTAPEEPIDTSKFDKLDDGRMIGTVPASKARPAKSKKKK
jgi:hypothetical protein